MSYILEALKKSEQERQSTLSSPPPPPVKPSFFSENLSTGKVSVVAGVFVVIILLAYYWFNHEPFESDVVIDPIEIEEPKIEPISDNLVKPITQEPVSISPEISTLYESPKTAEVPDKPIIRPSPSRVQMPKTRVVAPEPGAVVETVVETPVIQEAPKPVTIPFIHEMDWSLKADIPSIDYSAHIYAADYSKGFVILNGAKKHAGDELKNGVYVEKIEENSLVLSYKGLLFRLPAMKSWVNN